jgi:hypothetical protein
VQCVDVEEREYSMITALKWIAVVLLAGMTWVVVQITVEYFSPYRQIRIGRVRDRS